MADDTYTPTVYMLMIKHNLVFKGPPDVAMPQYPTVKRGFIKIACCYHYNAIRFICINLTGS
jgi:hypothetical protein